MGSGEEVFSQMTSAAMMVYLLQWVKQSGWVPWITPDTKRLNRLLSTVLAGASALGIHFAFDVQAGTLVISGLTTVGVGHGLWHWFNQVISQQVIYDTVAKK